MRLLAMLVTVVALAAQGSVSPMAPCPDCASEARIKAVSEEFSADIHAQKGMTCIGCHETVKGSSTAISYTIKRKRIPELCGSCHADPARIKQFNPSLRTDQLSQYRTSVHGIKFAHGDMQVAICTDCHTVHTIRPASDPRSSVHPLNVAETCKRCHSDAAYMKPYGVATDQFAGYVESVHYKAMVEAGDLSAPTCTTCHGSHGAAPPGVMAVANVCATCHVLQGKFFEESPHKQAFAKLELPGCVTCHESHRIHHPDDNFVGTGKSAVCGTCHIASEPAGQMADGTHSNFLHLTADIASAKSLLERAARSGMDVADAELELTQANDALIKARVSLHSAQPARVAADLEAGKKIVANAYVAGNAALRERNNRRKAVMLPVIALAALFVTAGLYVRALEKRASN
jgi:predicted CXXCH cytochrome family protein